MAVKTRRAVDLVHLRRMYVDCRYGQMHLATAFPPSGGFDEFTALLFLHDDGGCGADFNRCAAQLGSDRSIYSPDLPGSGASDGPAGQIPVANLAAAVADLLDQLRLRQVDLFGCGRGVLVAYALATGRPTEIRRLIVAGDRLPAAGAVQPVLELQGDCTQLLRAPAGPLVARLRAFLDKDDPSSTSMPAVAARHAPPTTAPRPATAGSRDSGVPSRSSRARNPPAARRRPGRRRP